MQRSVDEQVILAQGPVLARNPICDLLAVGEFVLVCLGCFVFLSRSRRLTFLRACVVYAALALVLRQRMCGDGHQTQRGKSWIPEKERAEKVLEEAMTIDGEKEWICKFCSESNVWMRWWRCRRC